MLSRRKFLGQLGAAAIIPSGMLALPAAQPQIRCYTLVLERVEGEAAGWRMSPPGRTGRPLPAGLARQIEVLARGGQRAMWTAQARAA